MSQPHPDTAANRERQLTRADRVLWAKERIITAARLLLMAMEAGDEPHVYRLALRERIREHDSALVALSKRRG